MEGFKAYLNNLKTKLMSLCDYSKDEEYLLVMYSLNLTREQVFLKEIISKKERQKVNGKLIKRLRGEPLNKIFGKQNFCGFEFKVNKWVLAPRVETELLVEKVINEIDCRQEKVRILDICTGTGCIGLSIKKLRPNKIKTLVLSDTFPNALVVAKENKRLLGIEENVEIIKSNMFERLKSQDKFDIITCNPPYITESEYEDLPVGVKNYDPKISLFGGKDGLDYYKILAKKSKDFLAKNGKIFMEIGSKQREAVEKLFKEQGYITTCYKDYSGCDRIVVGSISEVKTWLTN